MALTDSWLRSISGKPIDKMVSRSDRDGLSARVTPKGKVIFQFRYRWDGKADRIDLGTYPATSLKDARELALFYRSEIEQLRNPKVVKKIKIDQAITAKTVEGLLREWWGAQVEGKHVNDVDLLRSLEIHIFPKIGNIPHDEANLQIWLSLLEDISKRTPAVSGKLLQFIKLAHRWGIRRGAVKNNPLTDVVSMDIGVMSASGGRALDNQELKLLFSIIDKPDYSLRSRCLVKLCLLYGCRIGELLKAKVSDFDFDACVWVVPPENHKSGRKVKKPIVRPIIEPAKLLLKGLIDLAGGSDYLFPSPVGTHIRRGGHLYIFTSLNNQMKKYSEHYEVWSAHGLRKTMRTGVSDLTMPHVAEIMLGHKLPGVWQVYDKHTYLDEQREAYEKWWDKVTRIVYHSPNQECPAS
ncbi:MAG TPA: integrase [Morganella sp. (in: Bacteria)]|nr:integrase [Morganella sp. (in: enterobacteria)]